MRNLERDPCLQKPDHRDEIGFQVNGLSHLIRWLSHQYNDEDGTPSRAGMYGWLVGFLYDNRGRDIYQRDLQQQFSVRRSTMTGILQNMEKDGMITRTPVEWDARLKKIELTEAAIGQQVQIRRNIASLEAKLSAQLTPGEKETFIALCEKLHSGIEAAIKDGQAGPQPGPGPEENEVDTQ